MPEKEETRRTGFEVSREFEEAKRTIAERAVITKSDLRAIILGVVPLIAVFFIGCWLAGNPFEATVRVADSGYNQTHGLVGTSQWHIVWFVVLVGLIFEFMDAAAGMGFGTAVGALLLLAGFTPVQVVPTIMIEQALCGLVGTFLHQEFKNVEWRFSPMSETIKLWLLISVLGCIAILISITAIYSVFAVHKVWIKLYVMLTLLLMGAISLFQGISRKEKKYRPKLMTLFGFLAGFNKGIGGGGFGPVVTVGGVLSGIPVKSQLAVTAISEGTVSTFAVIIWFVTLSTGTQIDFLLLPSMMIAAIGSGIIAPFAVRVFPEKAWRWVVPIYCLCLAVYGFYRLAPVILSQLGG